MNSSCLHGCVSYQNSFQFCHGAIFDSCCFFNILSQMSWLMQLKSELTVLGVWDLENVPPSGGSGEDLNPWPFQLPEVAYISFNSPQTSHQCIISHFLSLSFFYKRYIDYIESNPGESSSTQTLALVIHMHFIL